MDTLANQTAKLAFETADPAPAIISKPPVLGKSSETGKSDMPGKSNVPGNLALVRKSNSCALVKPEDCCDDCGAELQPGRHVCEQCRAVRPLFPGHAVDPKCFQWAQDGTAMAKLRSIGPLVSLASTVSKKVGRRWIESTFQGVRLGYNQMPEVYAMCVQAARVLGLKKMPVVYVSGVRPWDALTFGTDDDAFIVVGSALVASFPKTELMFVLAREIGHILAGHALWKTVIQFLVGEQNPQAGLLKNGVAGLLDPTRWIEGAIEIPLLTWARQSEITADRAGLLAAASIGQARHILLAWSLKSPLLVKQINVEAWLQQQEQDFNDESIQLAELVSSSTPYISRRLKLLSDFDNSSEVSQFRSYLLENVKAGKQQQLGAGPAGKSPGSSRSIRCAACDESFKVDNNQLGNREKFAVRCPSKTCQQINLIASPPTQGRLSELNQQNSLSVC